MQPTQEMPITLSADTASLVQKKMEDGGYGSPSEVIEDLLHSLFKEEAQIEKWLREDVAPTYDRYFAGQETTISLDDVIKKHSRFNNETN